VVVAPDRVAVVDVHLALDAEGANPALGWSFDIASEYVSDLDRVEGGLKVAAARCGRCRETANRVIAFASCGPRLDREDVSEVSHVPDDTTAKDALFLSSSLADGRGRLPRLLDSPPRWLGGHRTPCMRRSRSTSPGRRTRYRNSNAQSTFTRCIHTSASSFRR